MPSYSWLCSARIVLLFKTDIKNLRTHSNFCHQAYTICGDQVLPNDRYYSNKIRHPYGILHASKAESITQQRHFKQQLSEKLRGYKEEERKLSEAVTIIKVECM